MASTELLFSSYALLSFCHFWECSQYGENY